MAEPTNSPPAAGTARRGTKARWWVGAGVAWLCAALVILAVDGLTWALTREYGLVSTSFGTEAGRIALSSIPGMVLLALAVWLTFKALGHGTWGVALAAVAALAVFGTSLWLPYRAEALRQADPAFQQPTTGSLTAQLELGGTPKKPGSPLTPGTVTFTGPTTIEVKVDQTGQARAENLLPGTYHLTATSPAFKNGTVTCNAASSVQVRVLSWQLIPVFCKTS